MSEMRHMYKDLRQKFVDSLRQDLIGPYDFDEELHESPTTSYIMGRLSPTNDDYTFVVDNEVDYSDESKEVDEDGTTDEVEYDETIYLSKNKQSSAGLKIFVPIEAKNVSVSMKWADYKNEKEEGSPLFKRYQKEFVREIDISVSNKQGYHIESEIYLSWLVHKLDTGYKMLSIYIENKRNNVKDNVGKHIFQVELEIRSDDEILVSENIANGKQEEEDYFFDKKPIFSRGYGCAAVWGDVIGNTVKMIKTDFLPEKEINGMDVNLEKFNDYFSMLEFSEPESKESTINKIEDMLGDYAMWINQLSSHEYMKVDDYIEIGKEKIGKCNSNLERMIEGLNLIKEDDVAYQAFVFMNKEIGRASCRERV